MPVSVHTRVSRIVRALEAIPWGLLGMIALVAVVEQGVFGSAERLAGYEGLGVRFAVEAAKREAPRCDVLALGDSVVKFGFDPNAVERRIGLKAYNLAVPGTPPPLTYAVFRRALDAGAKPKVLVVGQMTLGGDPWANIAQFGEFIDLDEAWSLAWSCRDPRLFGALMAARAIPSLRYRYAIRAFARGDNLPDPDGFLKTWAAGRGAELRVPPPSSTVTARMEPTLETTLFAQPWPIHAIYEQYLERLTRLAISRGITVFWLVPPLLPEAQAKRDALGLDALHTRNLRAIHSWMPGVVVLDARHSGYPASDFFDSIHLNARGAARLSVEIADVIASHRGHAGEASWVDLPRPDDSSLRIATDKAIIPPDSTRR
jgi:hypothetical protein